MVFIKVDMVPSINFSWTSEIFSESSSFKTTNAGPFKLYTSCVNFLNVGAMLYSNRTATNWEGESPRENQVRHDFGTNYERTNRITVSLE